MSAPEQVAALLRSTAAEGLLHAALTAGNVELPGFRARLVNWQFRPRAEVCAGYEVTYETPAGVVQEHLFATSAEVGPPAATLVRDGLRVDVWRHPDDPRLPGLAAACDPATVMSWLGRTPEVFDLTLLGYRPLRRAVLRATADGAPSFLKVARPDRADALVERQTLLARADLTAPVLARPAPGVVLTAAVPGRPLSHHLAGDATTAPSAADLVALLDRLPASVADLPRRPAWSERLGFHSAAAAERLPGSSSRLATLAERLPSILDAAPVGPLVPTHGDFYEANILVDGPRLWVIDLDAVGPGRREDDLACLLAHLAVLPGLAPDTYACVPAVVEAWAEDFARRVDASALAARVAAVLVSLVAGGVDDQAEHRLDLAEEWAARAG
ncbi:MAG: aminoglycoside phosphotransferase family protein [Actinobacteria bacterium]|nr:aminoglycoside phosphotransferase family protein [Actinomycetota bacterium]